MVISVAARKALLAAHLTASIGWIGAAGAYLALGIAAELSTNPETIRGAWTAKELVGWYVIVPLAVAALTTGIAMAIGTRWGLFRHYWVIFSLALNAFAAVVLVLHMPTVTLTAGHARSAGPADLNNFGGDIVHPTIGLGVLLSVLVLNIYKPRGLTRYGQRKHAQPRQT